MAQTYISYKRENQDKVIEIWKQIETGLRSRCGGTEYAHFVAQSIRAIEECDFVLFMYSDSMARIDDRLSDYNLIELEYAKRYQKDVIIINIDGSPISDSLSFLLGIYPWFDLNSLSKVVDYIMGHSVMNRKNEYECCCCPPPEPDGNSSKCVKETYFPTFALKYQNKIGNREISDSDEKVSTSVFAPAEVKRGDYMLVQVFLYLASEECEVARKASEVDKDAERKNHEPLDLKLNDGDKVQVSLSVLGEGVRIDEYEQEMVWHGHYTDCQFAVFVGDNCRQSSLIGCVVVSVNGIPKARMKFQTKITNNPDRIYARIENELFKKIFISYSHLDEDKVKYLAEGIKYTGVDYFFDRHYLETGDIYPVKIQEFIETADLFVLCWSKNAANSEYVKKECEQALGRISQQNAMSQNQLSIRPISIEPRAELPNEMKEIYNFGML